MRLAVSEGRTHFIGIGGIGMSALARLLLARGLAVSGSDAQASHLTALLGAEGADVTIGHRGELVEGAARVIVSDAIAGDNPEVRRARELGLRLQRRSELLAELAADHRLIAVSGTHGKTTVTAMIGQILAEAGLDPTVVLGGEYEPFGGNARIGRGEWMVAEACEAYESFLDLRPEIAVVTNIEADHLDHHKTEAHLRASFAQFLSLVPPSGCVVLCGDRPELRQLAPANAIWYGTEPEAEVRGTEPASDARGSRCRLWVRGREAGELSVRAPGRHNLLNALGALAAALRAGASLPEAQHALAEFAGVGRRFDVLGEAAGVAVVDDYAHHPTEIAATLAAARAVFPGRRLVAVFQPHLYSRTRDFAAGFATALEAADVVAVTEIYPAREAPIAGVSAALITAPLRRTRGEDGVLELAKQDVVTALARIVRPGDVVLMMGAGDIGDLARNTYRDLAGENGEQGT
jgi:UDP-N-acetylmuramate--alanine ligase